MKCSMSLKAISLLIVIMFLSMQFVQNVSAVNPMYDIYVGIIDSVQGVVSAQDYQIYTSVWCVANFSSWIKTIDSPRGSSEYRWVCVGYDRKAIMGVYSSGAITIMFPDYVIIDYVEILLYWGSGTYSIWNGVGYSVILIYLAGIANWYLYIKTRYISQQYWGSTIHIGMIADSGSVKRTWGGDLRI